LQINFFIQNGTNFTDQAICLACHQPILPQYYFCPNCGKKIKEAPLSTTIKTQAWIYAFSIILPMICFIFVTKWPGVNISNRMIQKPNNRSNRLGINNSFHYYHIWLVYTWTQQ